MERPFRRVRLLSLILLSALVASGARAAAIEKKDQIKVAALAMPGGPQADWQQWDSFLTNVVKKLGTDFQPALRDQLGETFLDSRYQFVQLLRVGSADPVPQLFTDAWNRLAPILKQAIPGATQSTASQYTSFIARWTRQALFPVRAAPGNFSHYAGCATERSWVVGAGGGDPLAYTAEIDADLRALLGFTGTLPDVHPSPLSGARPIGALVRQSIGALRRLPSALRTRQMPTSTD